MDRKQLINYIITNQNLLVQIEQEALLDYIATLNIKIVEHSDGSRINLDRVPLEKLSRIYEYMKLMIEKNNKDDCYLKLD